MSKDKPEIRFAGYTDAWEKHKFSEGMAEYTDRVMIQDDKDYPQLSVSNKGKLSLRGITNGKKIGRKRQAKINLKKHPNTLVFTRQTVEQGGIGLAPNAVDGAIVTENMPTIDVDTNVWNIDYLTAFFNTSQYYKNALLSNIEGGSAQVAIHEDKWLESEFSAAEFNEQNQIGTLFSTLNNLIVVNQRKVDLLKELKKGFLQKMFPKNGEDKPEIRFGGYTDAWEKRKLGEIGETHSGIGFPENEQGGKKGIPFFKVSGMNNFGNEHEMNVANNYVNDDQLERKKWKVINNVPGIIFAKVGAAIMLNRKRLIKVPFLMDNNTMEYAFDRSWNVYFGKTLFETLNLPKYAQVGALPSYNGSDIETISVEIPEKDEQERIGTFFQRLDQLITVNQRISKFIAFDQTGTLSL